MHRIAALFVVTLLVLSGGGNFADPVPATPAPLLPIPGTPQAPDPLGGFRGLQPTPPAVTPGPAGVSRLPDIQYSEFFQDDIVDFAGQFLQPRTAPDGRRAIPIHSQQLVNLPFGYVQDLTFSARVTLTSGAFQVSVRQSGAGEYRAMADTSGLVVLQRAGQTLATAQLPASHRFEYGVLLTVTAAGPRIEVRAGTDVVIAYDDPQPLPYGVISFGGMDFAPTSGWLSELTLSANVARDLDAGAALIEALAVGHETRQNQPLPDPGRIYFTRTSNGTSAIWSIKPDGSGGKIVVANATFGDISPDGRRLAFISNRDGALRLWVKLAEGVLFQLIKDESPVAITRPTWAHDNVRIAFIRGTSSVQIHDMRTGETTVPISDQFVASVDWSPVDDTLLVLQGVSTNAYELFADGTTRWVAGSGIIANSMFITGITYSPTGDSIYVVHQILPTGDYLYHVSRVDLNPSPVGVTLYEIRTAQNIPIQSPADITVSPDGQTIAVQIDPGTYPDPQIILLSAAGALLPQTISNASFSISWSGSAEFAETFERCVSIPVPTQGVALRPDLTQTPPAIGTPLPPDTRMEFTGRVIDQAMTPWLEVNAVMPQYATTPTPEATYATPYWVSAGAFSADGVYLDPCDDDPLINDPAAGNASDSYYLPLLQQPERILTPTYTPTQSPICIGITTLSQPANVRAYPSTQAPSLGLVNDGEEYTVTGKTDEPDDYDWYWYQIVFNGQAGWLRDDLIDVDEQQWACASLSPYNPTGIPNATCTPSPTIQPSRTPTYGTTPTRIPRLVPTQAQPLHAMADQIGLPLPFEVWPRATPQSGFQNGYGPNLYAYNSCHLNSGACQYSGTGRIHQGIDYYVPQDELSGQLESGEPSCNAPVSGGAVYAVCDGVIVPGISDGGSALQNSLVDGLSLRCFADDPRDSDGDGNPNVSNVIVVYNHLHPEDLPTTGTMVSAGQLLGFTRNYLVESIPEPTPRPCIAAHLDLQVFLATSYRGSDRGLQRQFNPLLLYSQNRADEHWLGDSSMQYPSGWNAFSLHGNTLDWIGVNYWTNPDATAFIADIAQFLAGMSYEPPNCIVSGESCTVIPNDMN